MLQGNIHNTMGRRGDGLLLLLLLGCCWFAASAQELKTIVSVVDESLRPAGDWLAAAVSLAETQTQIALKLQVFTISIEDETSAEKQLCGAIFNGVTVVLDLTAGGWQYGRNTADSVGIPYVHGQVSITQAVEAVDSLLQNRNATDAALIFSGEDELDQALYYLVGGSSVRVIVLVGLGDNSTMALKKMRPAPAYYVLFGTGRQTASLFDMAVSQGFVSRDSRWTVVVTGTDPDNFKTSAVPATTTVTLVAPSDEICCTAQRTTQQPCNCQNLNIPEKLIQNIVLTLAKVIKGGAFADIKGNCSSLPASGPSTDKFLATLKAELLLWQGVAWLAEEQQIMPFREYLYSTQNSSASAPIGTWTTERGIRLEPSFKNTPIKRFFRIGSIESRPWFYEDKTEGGISFGGYKGYCVELARRLSEMMEFDFVFVIPKDKKFGAKIADGSWNGLVADLANGETDLIVAPMTMTSEREEVIDFVAPYFDQSGISIVIRKRERQENLFKFMTVLKAEVWVSIVAALVVTGIMLWLLDRYSPYSAQNNSDKYSQGCRKFTLKESFWFALTSFTPQGGGEAPKALSGRTLVAAYWLFVVLMLATFTANLAAFLTVERMQSPVQSLEALARQAKIKFTTTRDTSVYEYFFNMARAEDELFRVWKELTLNSTTDQSKYRVWDYPIKEQYTHILQVIDDTGPMESSALAFQKVLENKDGEFAFIHDAAEIRYEIYHNCYLSEVGEPFAEQPYAIAVQQGSYLQEEISRAILELQKERYFESLLAKFWNSSARGDCPNDDDSEGITLQSLGGVFIATLIGLVLALIALAAEVLYHRKGGNGSSAVQDITGHHKLKGGLHDPKMVMPLDKEQISRINVTPAY